MPQWHLKWNGCWPRNSLITTKSIDPDFEMACAISFYLAGDNARMAMGAQIGQVDLWHVAKNAVWGAEKKLA